MRKSHSEWTKIMHHAVSLEGARVKTFTCRACDPENNSHRSPCASAFARGLLSMRTYLGRLYLAPWHSSLGVGVCNR